MGPRFPDETRSPGEDRSALFSDLYYSRGWARHLPVSAIEIMGALVVNGTSGRSAIENHLRRREEFEDGWQSSCWEELHQWTDEELAELREQFKDDPIANAVGDDEPDDAAGVMAADAARRERDLAKFDACSAALGLGPLRTMGDLFEFMVASQLLVSNEDDDPRYEINPAAPLPSEVLPLSNDERVTEDQMRWQELHEPTAQAIIELFRPDGDKPLDRLRTSMQRLARELDTDVESARAGALNLLAEGDFSATIDLERAEEHRVFELVVDWECFHKKRINLRFVGANDEDERSPSPGRPGSSVPACSSC